MTSYRIAVLAPLALLAVSCVDATAPPQVATAASPVVYGNDDRMDWYAHPDEGLRDLTAESIVALIRPGNLDESDSTDIRITAGSVGESRNFCEGERFYDDPRAANCSGTLIDDDLVLTAGHCVDDLADCRNYRYVFGYYYTAEGELGTMTSDDVYRCDELVVRRNSGGIDYAVVRLDRRVTGRRAPAAVHLVDEAIPDDAPVTIIGFGSGMPAKIDNGGRVVDPRGGTLDYFNATVDAFGGNSGSGVFNASREVVGILVRGATDYRTEGGCTVVNVLPEDSEGEDIVYVGRAIEALCETDYLGPLCGGPRGYCRTCTIDADCVDGWSCLPGRDGEPTCTAPCSSDADCRDDHTCDGAFCQTDLALACVDGNVWQVDACGIRGEQVEACTGTDVCLDGACAEGGEGDTCDVVSYVDAEDQTLAGTLSDVYTDAFEGSCGGQGRDRVWAFTVDREVRLTAQATGFDTVLYLRSSCDDASTEEDCDDDSNPPGDRGSRFGETLEPGTYFLILDSYGNPGGGDYEVELTFEEICPCEAGEVRCDGGTVQTCEGAGDACPDWVDTAACDDGETCFDGACIEQSEGDTCADAFVIEPVGQVIEGDLSAGFGNDAEGSCGGAGPDAIYTFTLTEPTLMTALMEGFDTVLHVRSACEDGETEFDCNDDARGVDENGSLLDVELGAGTWFLFADGFNDDVGTYQLTLAFENACTDQCEPDDFVCVSPVSYRSCGQFDDDSCWDWDTTATCEGDLRCSELAEDCIDPNAGGDDVGIDVGDDASDAGGLPDSGGEIIVDDAGDGGASGRGTSDGCSSAGGHPGPAVGWLLALGLVAIRRRR